MLTEETNKYYITEGTKAWVEYVLKYSKKADYQNKYTKDILLPNAFSSSTLAYSVDKQIKTKIGEAEPFFKETSILIGDAIHDYLQSRLSSSYVKNDEFRYRIPFEWKSLESKEIIVISHPDSWSAREMNLIEYKTSVGLGASGHIAEYMLRQVAFYWLIIKEQIGIDVDARVVKIWGDETGMKLGITEHTLKPDEKIMYSKEMVARAIEAATDLDKIYLERGVPQQSTTKATQ